LFSTARCRTLEVLEAQEDDERLFEKDLQNGKYIFIF
jgi:hypothetical protein